MVDNIAHELKAQFGVQCDALTTRGIQCRNHNRHFIPTGHTSHYASVHLCGRHEKKLTQLIKENKRLPLHHAGFLGAYNQYKYGYLVIDQQVVDWEQIKVLCVPKFWVG